MTDWSKSKVAELRTELKKRGLPQTGLKPVLVARLEAADNDEGTESEATVQALDNSSAAATSPDTISPVLASTDGPPNAPLQTETETETEAVETAAKVETQEPAQETAEIDVPTNLQRPAETVESSHSPAEEAHTSALPSVEPRETNEDQRKRKRRSQSPPPSARDSVRKRFRPDEEVSVDSSQSHAGVAEEVQVTSAEENAHGSESADTKMEDVEQEVGLDQRADSEDAGHALAEDALDHSSSHRDSRYKNLFPDTTTLTSAMGDIRDSEELEPERYVAQSLHPATSALYIRDFMRPLNPPTLKSHLAHLAAPPGHVDDPEVITEFYIDPIRTHAFVTFEKVSAAARVRSALHDRIWPNEKTRKPLWVDFVPAEKVAHWIDQEQETRGGGRGGKKWEILYDRDEHQVVTATLQEVGNIARPSQPARQTSAAPTTPPHGVHPDRILSVPTSPLHSQGQATAFSTGRERLDALFNYTSSKPTIYWQPVSKDTANRRLDSIDQALSKDGAAGRPLQGDFHRYTFEEDTVVDRGPEIFPGLRPPQGFRGPSGFGPRGGGSGGYQGRGGYASSFRGGRGSYDSYRGGYGGRGFDRWGGPDRRNDWRDERRDLRRDYDRRR